LYLQTAYLADSASTIVDCQLNANVAYSLFSQHQTVQRYRDAVSSFWRRPFGVLSRTVRCNFQDFQGPKSFPRTSQGLEIWQKIQYFEGLSKSPCFTAQEVDGGRFIFLCSEFFVLQIQSW